jgi:hypothetical protein
MILVVYDSCKITSMTTELKFGLQTGGGVHATQLTQPAGFDNNQLLGASELSHLLPPMMGTRPLRKSQYTLVTCSTPQQQLIRPRHGILCNSVCFITNHHMLSPKNNSQHTTRAVWNSPSTGTPLNY